MKINTKVRYAIKAMVALALRGRDAKPLSLSILAQQEGLSLAYLEQLFLNMKRLSLVKSVRGPKGGYYLAKPACAITLSDIMHAVGREVRIQADDSDRSESSAKNVTQGLWQGLESHIESYFRTLTLEDVCAQNYQDQKACQQFLVKAYAPNSDDSLSESHIGGLQ